MIIHKAPFLLLTILFLIILNTGSCSSFQFDLFNKLASQRENNTVFYSPITTLESLYLIAYSSPAPARKELLKLLGIRNMKQFDKTMRQLNSKLLQSNSSNPLLLLSNQIFTKTELREEYISFMQSSQCKANTTNLTKAKQVNTWISKATNGKILKLIGNIHSVDMLTLNTLFFNGTWRFPFDVSMTSPYTFENSLGEDVPVDFMSASFDSIGLFKNDKLQMIELPYADSDVSMLIVIPFIDVDELLGELDENMVNRYVRRMEKKKVKIALPKVNMESHVPMVNVLKDMGVKMVFDKGSENIIADSPLTLESFDSRTVFQFNEVGSIVANVNYGVYNGGMASESNEVDLVLSKPFIVILRHSKIEDYFLLIGKVSNLE